MRHPLPTLALAVLVAGSASSQTAFVGMGDSIGEGVQSADAFVISQQTSYLALIAGKLGADFPLPLIATNPFGSISSVDGRTRLDPAVEGLNLSVSGADLQDILETRSDAATEAEIDSETDLVLFPRQASQIEIVESLAPSLVVCWIGNNDALSAAISFDALDASQLTPVADFDARFTELADRLAALGGDVAFANVPDVTSIAFLLDEAALEQLTGLDITLLPEGSFTSLPAMLMLRLGLADETILLDPDWVLDSGEIDTIEQRIEEFNLIIQQRAGAIGAPVLNVNAMFKALVANPITVLGTPITNTLLGGMFSLDGVHPSNIGHAVVADQMIALINADLGLGIPRLTGDDFATVLLTDPHWDKDQDGVAVGRPFAGLLETLALVTGFTGDPFDFDGIIDPDAAPPAAGPSAEALAQALDASADWEPPRTREEAVRLFKRIWNADG